MLSRFVTVGLVLSLSGAGLAPCAGWASTAQARHDCCVEGQCPDQLETDSHSTSHRGPISQAQADACCAASEQQNQQRSSQVVGAAFLLAPLVEIVLHTLANTGPPELVRMHVSSPLPPPVPLHLLFSVFLV
jgi:hypothetical protein